MLRNRSMMGGPLLSIIFLQLLFLFPFFCLLWWQRRQQRHQYSWHAGRDTNQSMSHIYTLYTSLHRQLSNWSVQVWTYCTKMAIMMEQEEKRKKKKITIFLGQSLHQPLPNWSARMSIHSTMRRSKPQDDKPKQTQEQQQQQHNTKKKKRKRLRQRERQIDRERRGNRPWRAQVLAVSWSAIAQRLASHRWYAEQETRSRDNPPHEQHWGRASEKPKHRREWMMRCGIKYGGKFGATKQALSVTFMAATQRDSSESEMRAYVFGPRKIS